MRKLKLLVERAITAAGSQSELARRLGLHRQVVYEWAAGTRPISCESAALLAEQLGLTPEEAREWVATAVCENPKNAERRERLERTLFGHQPKGPSRRRTTVNTWYQYDRRKLQRPFPGPDRRHH
jgi:DNA-binding transcriptional regulator YdaS (Cro superfamily)